MQFTYTISEDDDFTPWGDPHIIEEETRDIAAGRSQAYVVTVRVAGPVEMEGELTGCVVPVTDTGTYHDLDAIQDDHLRDCAKQLADNIADSYLDVLTAKRDEINAMIQQMGGV